MQTESQTKITPSNQKQFYQATYQVDNPLIDLPAHGADQYLLIDCRGQDYKNKYPELDIVILETIFTAKQFQLGRDKFDYLIDSRTHNAPTWPKITTKNCMLVFDHSPILKYLTVEEISSVLESCTRMYQPSVVLLVSSLFFVDDDRMRDRLDGLVGIKIKNYVVEKFSYDTKKIELIIQFRLKKES
jgi:hypothetical protein